MLRPSNPADLFSLLMWQARMRPVAAAGRYSLATGSRSILPWGGLMQEWFFHSGAGHSWVLSRRGMPVGLVSCRRYKGPGSWEIDCLLVPPDQAWASLDILNGLGLALGRLGAERLVLRLSEGSPLHSVALDAGFTPLVRERLYMRSPFQEANGHVASVPASMGSSTCQVRPSQEADVDKLFHLYSVSVPTAVRQMEGLATGEWSQTRGGSDLRPERRWVEERDAQIRTAVTVERGGGKRCLLEVLTSPRDPGDVTPVLGEVLRARGDRALVVLLPEYLWISTVERALAGQGFRPDGILVVYVKPVIARAQRVGLMPVRA